MTIVQTDPFKAAWNELAALRHAVTGVQGCVVAGDDGLNIGRLHLEARQATARLAEQLEIRPVPDSGWFPGEAADHTGF